MSPYPHPIVCHMQTIIPVALRPGKLKTIIVHNIASPGPKMISFTSSVTSQLYNCMPYSSEVESSISLSVWSCPSLLLSVKTWRKLPWGLDWCRCARLWFQTSDPTHPLPVLSPSCKICSLCLFPLVPVWSRREEMGHQWGPVHYHLVLQKQEPSVKR